MTRAVGRRARERILRWAPVACALVMLLVSVLPISGRVGVGDDKWNHLLVYTALALLVRVGYPRAPYSLTFLLCVAHGALIEIVQAFVAHRSSEWADLGADAAGALLGAVVMALLPTRERRPFSR